VPRTIGGKTDTAARALKIGLLIMAGLAFLTILPGGRLPDYRPGQLPADPVAAAKRMKASAISA